MNLVGQGYFQFSRIENLVGSRRADHLTGNDEANHIEGGRGNDTIMGGDGGDVLEGNEHNDELWGGTDGVTDTFRFRAGDGTDTIKDIEVGIDLIDIIGATQLSDIGFTQSGADVELTFADITIIVENTTVAQL